MSARLEVPAVKSVRGAMLAIGATLVLSGCGGTEISNNCSGNAQCTGSGHNRSESGGAVPEARPSSAAVDTHSPSLTPERPSERRWTLRLRDTECGYGSVADPDVVNREDVMGDVDPDDADLGHGQAGSCTGVYGMASYYTENGAKKMKGYVHDTAGDDHCAMLWMDFTTSQHNHHDAQAYLACGKGNQAWGNIRSSTDSSINGIRAAVCITGVHGCYDQNGNYVEWPYRSYEAHTCWWYRIDTGTDGKCGDGNPFG